MEKYLISASSYREALYISKQMNLNVGEFIYITLLNNSERKRKILGMHNVNKNHLVGYYNNMEWRYLTGGEKE